MKLNFPQRVVLFLFLTLTVACFGQDPLFSQFFANPLNLNPGFAGTAELPRVALNYRDQWPQQSGTYSTYSMSFDGFVRKMNGGLALHFLHDRELDNILSTTSLSVAYSYHVKAGDFSFFSAGLQAGMVYRQLNTENLIFPGMINQLNGDITGTLPSGFESKGKFFPDFAVGVVGQTGDYFWGMGVHHLNRPDESLFEGDQKGNRPLKYTLHFGGRIHDLHHGLLSRRFTLSPNLLYQQQGSFKQDNLGIYMIEKSVTFGAWYRNNLSVRPDALIALIGLSKSKFQFGYSFDLTLSKLSGMSYGSHEISLTFFLGTGNAGGFRERLQIPPI